MVLTSVESGLAQFNPSCTEQVILLDYQHGHGWFKINNNQQSYQPPSYSTESIAELAFAESSGKLVPAKIGWSIVYNDMPTTWTNVNDTQNPNWVNINDNQ